VSMCPSAAQAREVASRFAALHESGSVQMLWGERRGHGTFGAVQQLPMELPHVATLSFRREQVPHRPRAITGTAPFGGLNEDSDVYRQTAGPKPSGVIVIGGTTCGRFPILMIGSGPLPAPPENEQESWRLIHSHQGVFGWEPVASETLIGLRRPAATDRPLQYDSPSPQQ
jgi:hypothetical protein